MRPLSLLVMTAAQIVSGIHAALSRLSRLPGMPPPAHVEALESAVVLTLIPILDTILAGVGNAR
jgi:hypothetical protein